MQNSELKEQIKNDKKDLFLATVIHDLKNPLIAQIRSLELLRKGFWGKLNNEQNDILDIIIESSNFMKELLYSLLETFKIKNCITKLAPETFNINELINLCINEYKVLAQGNDIKIVYKSTSHNVYILADKALMRRVISNLLDNSIKYGFNNTEINIELKETSEKILIRIKNTGYKLTDNSKKLIFNKYFSGVNYNNTGIGLGLYYCKNVIEAHNGQINVISNGNINEFLVEIPKIFSGEEYLNFV